MEKEIKKLVIREDGAILPEVTNLSHAFALGHLGDAPLTQLVAHYFEDGYEQFDQLCRTAYADILPTWEAAVVPWDQIIADRSHTWCAMDRPATTLARTGCGTRGCSTEQTASRSARQRAASDTERLTILSA